MSDMWRWAKEKMRSTQYILSGRTDNEKLVLEATNDEKWGPSNSQMQEIARLTFNYSACDEVKKVIWERLSDPEIRHVQKTLILLEYLLRNGHTSFRSEAKSMSGILQSLSYSQKYSVGEEAQLEAVVRKKSKDILTMANDNEIYEAERAKASKLKSKVTSFGNDGGYGYGGYNSGYSSSNYGSSNYSSSHGNYESNTRSAPKAQNTKNDDEYEYEYDDEPPAQNQKQSTPSQPVNNSSTQSRPNNSSLLPPPPGKPMNHAKAPMVQQQPFDPFGNSNQSFDPFSEMSSSNNKPPQNQPNNDPLLDIFGPSTPAPTPNNQSNTNNSNNQFDDLLNLTSPQPQTQQPPQQQQVNLLDDFLGPTTSASNNVQSQSQPQPQPQTKKSNMLSEFSDVIDFDNLVGNQKNYGKAQTTRGSGTALGGNF
ncbi:ENTH domain containing protein [Histomonas meleagridis]|uniref:ENTH domain containing protein n=1 Tax=Histomonas meleagridis TaxID=135588 RepID=UPI0035599749|nr:ENTH domain containing protein [Histomonas meleagridis]KAH0797127.1 ENTH domain containing protein [Histomonas meleagridis]